MPRVSVIIPAFNAESHLAETLTSVVTQTHDDWEAIVVDDASTDRTSEVAEKFGARFTVIRSPRNEGTSGARNRGVAAAQGELLAFLDHDDLLLPNYLDAQTRFYDETQGRYRNVGIVACDARVQRGGRTLERTYMEIVRFPPRLTLDRLLVSNPILARVMTPRAAVEEAGGFYEEIAGSEDYDLWLRILERGYRVVANRQALAVYRLAPDAISADAPRVARGLQLTYLRALERGNLSPRQRRIARRSLRLSRGVEKLELLRAERRRGKRPFREFVRAFPTLALVTAENPRTWPMLAERLVRRKPPLSR